MEAMFFLPVLLVIGQYLLPRSREARPSPCLDEGCC